MVITETRKGSDLPKSSKFLPYEGYKCFLTSCDENGRVLEREKSGFAENKKSRAFMTLPLIFDNWILIFFFEYFTESNLCSWWVTF
jgi:hypothetical protein